MEANGSPPRKKARKGKKKSKAERLSRGLNLTTTAPDDDRNHEQHDTNGHGTTVSLEALRSLLNAPDATTSAHWDRAQALAMRLATPDARQLMVRSLVYDRQAHKAAVHYARRLRLPQEELVAVLGEGRDDALRCLAVARFLVDADVALVDNAVRVAQFVVPWLDAHRAHTSTTAAKEADEEETEAAPLPTLPSAFATAARFVLQPNATSKKPSIVAEKLDLQRTLVRTLLQDDATRKGHGHAGFLLQFASSFASVLQDAAAVDDGDSRGTSGDRWPSDATESEKQRRSAIASQVEHLLKMLWPDATVVSFGSSATDLLLPEEPTSSFVSSQDDVDLCVLLPSCPQFLDDTAPLVADIKDHLALYVGGTSDASDVLAVTRARVPIVKWTDASTQLQCDLCVNNLAALWNTQLTIQLTRDPAVRAFSLWVKQWYKHHRQSGGFAAAISSYGMQLLVFHFLQHHGVLPSAIDCGPLVLDAEALQKADILAEIQHRVANAVETATTTVSSESTSKSTSLWSLVVSFFAFYGANAFDFEHGVVSLRAPSVTKAAKEWTRRNWRFSLSIEDPIETTRDLGSLFSRISLTRFRSALVEGCVRIADAHAAGETVTPEGRERVVKSLLLTDPAASLSK